MIDIYSLNRAGKKRSSNLYQTKMAGLIIAFSVSAIYLTVKHQIFPFRQPHIYATPFSWPPHCGNKAYFPGDDIGDLCGIYPVPAEIIHNYNIEVENKDGSFYRVGDDMVEFDCKYTQSCRVGYVIRNAYYR